MTRTKNRLFKTLVTVMLLFITAFAVTGNAFAESSEVSSAKTVNVDYTQKTVTLTANCNCSIRVTINVQRKQGSSTFKGTCNITANEPIELNVEELFSDETAIITEVSGDIVETNASIIAQANLKILENAQKNTTIIICIFSVFIIVLTTLFWVCVKPSNEKQKKE